MTASRSLRAGNTLIALGLLLALATMMLSASSATAAATSFVSDNPVDLAISVSEALVPQDTGQAIFLLPESGDPSTWAAPAALAAVPDPASLLFVPTAGLSSDVTDEIVRALAPEGVVYAVAIGAADTTRLEAMGFTVVAVDESDPVAISLALNDETFGVSVGTSQRAIGIAATPAAHREAAAALVHGTNLALPVIALGSGQTATVPSVARELRYVADQSLVADDSIVTLGSPVAIRIFDADVTAMTTALDGLVESEPLDGDLLGRLGTTIVALELAEERPHPGLLASVIAARAVADGFDAQLVFVADAAAAQALSADGEVTFIDLSAPVVEPPPAPAAAPLPTTGGGVALAGLLVISGSLLRRRARTER